jgi:hypothetical protein
VKVRRNCTVELVVDEETEKRLRSYAISHRSYGTRLITLG